LKNGLLVIPNQVKDIELVDRNRFFATLRMTNYVLPARPGTGRMPVLPGEIFEHRL
jgi:hypothetical protein